jgi:hypothetical protein
MAETSLDEFSYVSLPDDDLERLRFMLINGNSAPTSFYPTVLTQIVTKGLSHNHAGSIMEMQVQDFEKNDGSMITIPIYRFYFDGLIINTYMHLPKLCNVEDMQGLVVGSSENLVITTVEFENRKRR